MLAKGIFRAIGFVHFLIIINSTALHAQHFNFSQYDLTPLRINPGLVGTSGDAQLIFHHRNQVTNAAQTYKSSMFTATFPLVKREAGARRWGGVGISVLDDRTGSAIKFINQVVSANFAYNVNFTKDLMLSMGLQTDINSKKLSAEGMTTGMQYRDWSFDPSMANGEDLDQLTTSLLFVSSGLFLYKIDQNKRNKHYVGVSFYNLNRPDQSHYNKADPMPVTGIITAGFRAWERGPMDLSPQFLYSSHAGNNLFNFGGILSYDLDFYPGSNVSGRLDLALRHIPGKEGIVALQYYKPNYVIGFSYDFPVASSAKEVSRNATEIVFSLKAPVVRGEKKKNKKVKKKKAKIKKIKKKKLKINKLKKKNNSKKARLNKSQAKNKKVEMIAPSKVVEVAIPDSVAEANEDNLKNKLTEEDLRSKGILKVQDLLKNFEFDFNSSDIKESSFTYLDELVKLMIQEPALKIKIIGHTDDVGSEGINLKISKKRALVVQFYLISNGISSERIKTEGKGESEPKYPNTNSQLRALNRRVDFVFY